jgi:hypothetical protein
VPLGGSLFRGAALEVPDDSLQAWPAASIAAFNGHGFLVRKPLCCAMRFPWKKQNSPKVRPVTRDFAAMSFDQLADHAQGLVTSNRDAGRMELVTAIRTAQAQVRAANWQRWSTVVTVVGILVALFQHH